MIAIHTEKQRKYFDEVIRMYFEESMEIDRIAREIPVVQSTIIRWVNAYSSPLQPSKKQNKLHLLNKAMELRELGIPITKICRKLGVPRPTLYRWLAKDAERRPVIMEKPGLSRSMPQDCQARIAELEEKLWKAELARDAYEEMINIAEAKYNIRIRKKKAQEE